MIPPKTANHVGSNSEVDLSTLVSNNVVASEFRKRASCKESRRILRIREDELPYNLTTTTLAGPEMLSEMPYVLTDDEEGTILAFFYLGTKLAGHAKIVHGGIAGVLLDECMGRACFSKLVGRIAVTAKLDLEYKSPIPVETFVLIRAETTRTEGRKAWVSGVIENARDGRVLVQAKGLFIEPRWASEMAQVI